MGFEMQSALDADQVRAFLIHHFNSEVTDVAPIGAGAWSRCFGFRQNGQALVVRFGKYADDFQKDQRAHTFAAPDLPIPQVLAIGSAFDGYYCISTRAFGIPLEQVSAHQWRALVPALADALEALRRADISATRGFGSWRSNGMAPHASWSSFLLSVGDDTPDRRTHGWRRRLAATPDGEAAFHWGFDMLQRLASDAIPRCFVHCDLINRNVLVEGARITGIFDWGCSLYGDHLYDLAWFEFWAPWHPNLDVGLLRLELERRWRATGYLPEDLEARLRACYLHIGLDHIAYNAHLGDWPTLIATAARMRALAESG